MSGSFNSYNPTTVDNNSPSCVMVEPLVTIDIDAQAQSGVTSTELALDPLFEYYIMYSEEAVRDRFTVTFDNGNAANFVSVVREIATNEWRVLSNVNNPVNAIPFTVVATDTLIAEITSTGTHALFSADGNIFGIRNVSNGGGLAIADNTYNGTANAGELDLSGVFSITTNVMQEFELQLDGTYHNQDGSIIYKVQEVTDLGGVPCVDEDASCPDWDASNPSIEYHELGINLPAQGALGSIVAPTTNIVVNGLAIGDSQTIQTQFVGQSGRLLDVDLIVTNVAGGNHPLSWIAGNGIFSHNGAGRYRVEVVSTTLGRDGNPLPLSFAWRPTSFQSSSERWWADGTNATIQTLNLTPVDVHLNPNGVPIEYPTSGIFGTGTNDQRARIIGYRNKTSHVFEWNSGNNVGSVAGLYLYEGAELVDVPVCELLEDLSDRVDAVESQSDIEERTDTIITAAGSINADTIVSFLPDNVGRKFHATANTNFSFGNTATVIVDGVQTNGVTSPHAVPQGAQGWVHRDSSGNAVIVYQTVNSFILTSPNGTNYQLSVDNSGGLVTTAV